MKIGVVTYWTSSDNYGQQLQAYALQTVLRKLGHDPYLIRFVETPVQTLLERILRYIRSPRAIIHRLAAEGMRAAKEARKESHLASEWQNKNNERQFRAFQEKWLSVSAMIYHSFGELRNNPPAADMYIAGSDQIWGRPLLEPSSAVYFLNFGSQTTRRISYAASIGRQLEEMERPVFQRYLRLFDAVSVREESAQEQCQEVGVSAKVTLDPTLLLCQEDYFQIQSDWTGKKGRPYAFLYFVNVKSPEEIYWRQTDDYLRTEGLVSRMVIGSGYHTGREVIDGRRSIFATIPQWLDMIAGAECVFTTSYHGVIFSIIMHRPFIVFKLAEGRYRGNDRLSTLLGSIGLTGRIFNSALSIEEQMAAPISWETVDDILARQREESMDYLMRNLQDRDETDTV